MTQASLARAVLYQQGQGGKRSWHTHDEEEMMAQQTPKHGLAVGAPAPEFALPASDGSTVSLAALRAGGPVLLVFYRGWW